MTDSRQLPLPVASPDEAVALFRYGLIADLLHLAPGHRRLQAQLRGDPGRDIVFEDAEPEGGFVVRKPESPAVSLTVAPHLEAAAMGCHYRFTSTRGLPPREHRFELVFTGVEGETMQMKHHETGQVFTTADALSEFLLVPVFTGRPR